MAKHTLTLAASCLLAATGIARAAIPTDFNLEGLTGTDVRLNSYVECNAVSCSIAYEIWSKLLDTAFEVNWVDNKGDTLVTARQDPTSLFGGNGQGLAWSWWRVGPQPPTTTLTGEARFTPGLGGGRPCDVRYNCPADYLDWASLYPDLAPEPSPGSDDDDEVAETNSRLDRLIPLSPITDPVIDFDTEEIIEYTSRVSFISGLFHYFYLVENKTLEPLPYTWLDAGLGGVLDPLSSASRSFTSPLGPREVRSLASVQLGNSADSTVTGVNALLAPVPLPAGIVLLPGGILVLLVRKRLA
ncbi:MAG: hypothetical protein HKO62_05585 [Gammaproteobacteria bacterium]|nr:hypothetical protein [Gammaproteobacteria bacterium]NNM00201.1 hypothetical protein [Gammaproteobacteria bacterium]